MKKVLCFMCAHGWHSCDGVVRPVGGEPEPCECSNPRCREKTGEAWKRLARDVKGGQR